MLSEILLKLVQTRTFQRTLVAFSHTCVQLQIVLSYNGSKGIFLSKKNNFFVSYWLNFDFHMLNSDCCEFEYQSDLCKTLINLKLATRYHSLQNYSWKMLFSLNIFGKKSALMIRIQLRGKRILDLDLKFWQAKKVPDPPKLSDAFIHPALKMMYMKKMIYCIYYTSKWKKNWVSFTVPVSHNF